MQVTIYATDLQILPDNQEEKAKIMDFLKSKGCRCIEQHISDVKLQPWFGKLFIEVPFRADLKNEIENLFN